MNSTGGHGARDADDGIIAQLDRYIGSLDVSRACSSLREEVLPWVHEKLRRLEESTSSKSDRIGAAQSGAQSGIRSGDAVVQPVTGPVPMLQASEPVTKNLGNKDSAGVDTLGDNSASKPVSRPDPDPKPTAQQNLRPTATSMRVVPMLQGPEPVAKNLGNKDSAGVDTLGDNSAAKPVSRPDPDPRPAAQQNLRHTASGRSTVPETPFSKKVPGPGAGKSKRRNPDELEQVKTSNFLIEETIRKFGTLTEAMPNVTTGKLLNEVATALRGERCSDKCLADMLELVARMFSTEALYKLRIFIRESVLYAQAQAEVNNPPISAVDVDVKEWRRLDKAYKEVLRAAKVDPLSPCTLVQWERHREMYLAAEDLKKCIKNDSTALKKIIAGLPDLTHDRCAPLREYLKLNLLASSKNDLSGEGTFIKLFVGSVVAPNATRRDINARDSTIRTELNKGESLSCIEETASRGAWYLLKPCLTTMISNHNPKYIRATMETVAVEAPSLSSTLSIILTHVIDPINSMRLPPASLTFMTLGTARLLDPNIIDIENMTYFLTAEDEPGPARASRSSEEDPKSYWLRSIEGLVRLAPPSRSRLQQRRIGSGVTEAA